MKPFYDKRVSTDEIQFYLTSQINIIPELYNHFLDSLIELEHCGQVSLIPITKFQAYHRKFAKFKTGMFDHALSAIK